MNNNNIYINNIPLKTFLSAAWTDLMWFIWYLAALYLLIYCVLLMCRAFFTSNNRFTRAWKVVIVQPAYLHFCILLNAIEKNHTAIRYELLVNFFDLCEAWNIPSSLILIFCYLKAFQRYPVKTTIFLVFKCLKRVIYLYLDILFADNLTIQLLKAAYVSHMEKRAWSYRFRHRSFQSWYDCNRILFWKFKVYFYGFPLFCIWIGLVLFIYFLIVR